jgi:hypothetical protein
MLRDVEDPQLKAVGYGSYDGYAAEEWISRLVD